MVNDCIMSTPQPPESQRAAPRRIGLHRFSAAAFWVTPSTVGYGDIIPVPDVVRRLAAMEVLPGSRFGAVLIARRPAFDSSAGLLSGEPKL
jgi:hypothetical protein